MRSDPRPRACDERGAALLIVLLCTTLLMALGGGLAVLATTEVRIAAHFVASLETQYAAEAALEQVLPEVLTAASVDAVLRGEIRSSRVDGDPAGMRVLPDATTLQLAAAAAVERCGRPACADGDRAQRSEERPYGANNPQWQLYASGSLRAVLGSEAAPAVYVVVWAGDDPLEVDGDPLTDGSAAGAGTLMLRARAYGRLGTRRGVEAVVSRDDGRLRVVAWRQL